MNRFSWLSSAIHVGQDDGSLVWPTCIALDSQENLFISDEWLNRISSFSKDGGIH